LLQGKVPCPARGILEHALLVAYLGKGGRGLRETVLQFPLSRGLGGKKSVQSVVQDIKLDILKN